MRRLIDADALIKDIRSHYENVYCENATLNNFYRLAHEHVIDVVNVQKTAYDTEKVVADLEQLKVETKKNNYKADFALDIAIDIVKGEI